MCSSSSIASGQTRRDRLAEVASLAFRTGTPLGCEAAAAAALPIIRHLSHRADEIERLWGIVNGTNNFILTRLEQDELPMETAIALAQKLGLAEADPSADIDGHDAAAKLTVLAYRAFGVYVPPTSFDGWVSKVNHHQSVSEYFTPPEVLARNGFDRLVRLAIGLESSEDLVKCLDFAFSEA